MHVDFLVRVVPLGGLLDVVVVVDALYSWNGGCVRVDVVDLVQRRLQMHRAPLVAYPLHAIHDRVGAGIIQTGECHHIGKINQMRSLRHTWSMLSRVMGCHWPSACEASACSAVVGLFTKRVSGTLRSGASAGRLHAKKNWESIAYCVSTQ